MAEGETADLSMAGRPVVAGMSHVWWPRLATALSCLLALSACSETVALSGSTLEPAIVPLRAIPQVFVISGELAAERQIAQALAKHLGALGYNRVEVLDETGLRARLRGGGAGRAMAIVELVLLRREDYHYGYAAQRRTLCDSVGCFSVPGSGRIGLPSLEATLVLHVRVGPSMTVRQTASLRTVVFAEDLPTLRQISTSKLQERLQRLVDVQRSWLAAEFYDEGEASEALDLAEDGHWQEAAQLYLRAAAHRGRLPDARARLLYNAGMCQTFVDEGVNLDALALGMQWMKEALRLAPRDSRIEHGLRFLRSRQRSANQLHAQQAAAHHNFTVAGMVQPSKP